MTTRQNQLYPTLLDGTYFRFHSPPVEPSYHSASTPEAFDVFGLRQDVRYEYKHDTLLRGGELTPVMRDASPTSTSTASDPSLRVVAILLSVPLGRRPLTTEGRDERGQVNLTIVA
jgi:hypothetical protein